jgi:SagB-type dehydrogenase family enzyme
MAEPAPLAIRRTWRLVGRAELEHLDGRTLLRHTFGTAEIIGPKQIDLVLAALSEVELDEQEMAALVAVASPELDTENVEAILEQVSSVLSRLPMAFVSCAYGSEGLLLRLVPVGMGARPIDVEIEDEHFVLSRFAYLRSLENGAHLSVASPLSWYRAELGQSQSLLGALGRLASGPVRLSTFPSEQRVAVSMLVSAGIVVEADRERSDSRLATWSFHDLLFHSLSRPGRSDAPFGAHYAHTDLEPPPPVPSRQGRRFKLSIPNFDSVVERDPTLTVALESRHSVRTFPEQPLDAEQLGELLWRCQRARREVPIPGGEGLVGLERPYPTGGLSADLELHLVIRRCEGIAPGLYAYDGATHELVIEGAAVEGDELVWDASVSTGMSLDPPILVVITSRFARMGWKYERISYAVTMKHVGILMQTIYLVSTAMGLGACALGSGNPMAAASAFGLDWLVESSVGEVLLGVDPTPATASEWR